VNTVTACSPPQGYTASGGDCDDTAGSIHPGASERCNGVDDNCDGLVDNECTNRVCTDQEVADLEACLVDNCQNSSNPLLCASQQCVQVVTEECALGFFALYQCADAANCLSLPEPEARVCMYVNCQSNWETVYGNVVPTECVDGGTRPCGSDIGICSPGMQICSNGFWGACVGAVEAVPETCNGLDDDCDGQVDEDPTDGVTYYVDGDGDGYCGEQNVTACEMPPNTCTSSNDCNDGNPDVHPGQTAFFMDDDGDGSFDYNCDGQEEHQSPLWSAVDSGSGTCTLINDGWVDSIPACGQTGTFGWGALFVPETGCAPEFTDVGYPYCR